MSYHLRRPIQWGDRDTDSIPMIVEHIGYSIIFVNICDNPDMPEMIGWEDIEDDDIPGLPFLEDIWIIWYD